MQEGETLARIPFWFLRHGETDWNARGLSQGNVDIPLNPTGLAQARSAAELLRNRGIGAIVASPLARARVTAEIVAEALGLRVEIEDRLREVAFGVQEGQPMTDWFANWVAGEWTPEGAETFAALRARAVAAVNRAPPGPRRCWWSATARCSGRCVRRWGWSRMSARATPCRSGASRPAPAAPHGI